MQLCLVLLSSPTQSDCTVYITPDIIVIQVRKPPRKNRLNSLFHYILISMLQMSLVCVELLVRKSFRIFITLILTIVVSMLSVESRKRLRRTYGIKN